MDEALTVYDEYVKTNKSGETEAEGAEPAKETKEEEKVEQA